MRSKLQVALKDQPDLQISEEHLMQTMRQARMAYQNRRQRERIRYPAFLLRQVRFVGAPVWLLQGFLLLCAFWLFGFADIGTVSNLAPRHLPVLLGCFAVFIAMTSIPFIGRSVRYRMLETEMATRISIPKLLLARISIIGIGNVLLLAVSFLLASTKAEFGAGSVALYLLDAYLFKPTQIKGIRALSAQPFASL
jgi:ABC-type antimicrobial peptide transport system permease subunit